MGAPPRTSSTNDPSAFVPHVNVVDIYRERHPDEPGYTWGQAHHLIPERLDMFLVTESWTSNIEDIQV